MLQPEDLTMISNNIEVSRVMMPDDSNLAGNVHGGTILKMIEEAGAIIATRHCNSSEGPECYALLARVERTDFVEPMFVGEVAQLHAELSYSSPKSLEVQCIVFAENVVKGIRRLTNRATLWYVPVTLTPPFSIVTVPPMTYEKPEDETNGQKRHEAQKKARLQQSLDHANDDTAIPGQINVLNPISRSLSLEHSVEFSQSSLIVTLTSSDCNNGGFASGGSTMKKMDTVAGIVAFRHCKTNVVTASIEAVDFHHKVRNGLVMTITGRAIFNSEKTLDIEVFVDCEDIIEGRCFRACSAIFTFVSLGETRRPQKVPHLKLLTDLEKSRFELGKQRYLKKKEMRQRKS